MEILSQIRQPLTNPCPHPIFSSYGTKIKNSNSKHSNGHGWNGGTGLNTVTLRKGCMQEALYGVYARNQLAEFSFS